MLPTLLREARRAGRLCPHFFGAGRCFLCTRCGFCTRTARSEKRLAHAFIGGDVEHDLVDQARRRWRHRRGTRAAAQACEMRQDTSLAVRAEQLCATWKKRVDEAEFRWKVGGGRDDDRNAEFDRLSKTYRDTTCVR